MYYKYPLDYRQYDFNDILTFDIRPEQQELYLGDHNSVLRKNYSWAIVNATDARTYGYITPDGFKISFMCGYHMNNEFNADVFFVFHKDFQEMFAAQPRAYSKIFKDLVDFAKVPRLQTFVLGNFAKSQRLIEWMGFKKEGLLRKYTYKGDDVILYSYIRE
jgi:RimJ/RimL family protein N-acetyltransferase